MKCPNCGHEFRYRGRTIEQDSRQRRTNKIMVYMEELSRSGHVDVPEGTDVAGLNGAAQKRGWDLDYARTESGYRVSLKPC